MLIGVDDPAFEDPIGMDEKAIAVLLRSGGRLERHPIGATSVAMCFGCADCTPPCASRSPLGFGGYRHCELPNGHAADLCRSGNVGWVKS